MASFVSSILHNSAHKIESMSLSTSKQKSKNNAGNNDTQKNVGSRLLAMHASTPILLASPYYHHPQMSFSAENTPAPPPYDSMQQQHSPTPTPSTSWSALAEKIKDDVTNTFMKSKSVNLPISHIDRHGISQGMKLVSIAAAEYEQGNESVALDIYLTGVDKIIMALPNKTDKKTKIAIREKLRSVEEKVGILHLATSQERILQEKSLRGEEIKSSVINSFMLSTIATISSKAYQTATTTPIVDTAHSCIQQGGGDSMICFKRLGQYIVDITVNCAVLVKQSPLPGKDLVSFLVSYIIQLFLWFDAQYHFMQKVQDLGIQCIKFGLQADERYRLHEFLSEGLYMLIAAGLKAAVAFNEAPRYAGHSEQVIAGDNSTKDIRHLYETPKKTTFSNKSFIGQQQKLGQQSPLFCATTTTDTASATTCSPEPSQKARTSWVWPW